MPAKLTLILCTVFFSLSQTESAQAKIANGLKKKCNGHREKCITFIRHTPFIN